MPEPNDSRKQAADGNGISLRDFIDREIRVLADKLDERDKAHASEHRVHELNHEKEHHATQLALDTATTSLDKRLDSMNEFRNQLRDQAVTFARKEQMDDLKLQILDQIALINKTLARFDTERASTKGYILGMGAVIGVLVIVANFVAGFISF